VQVLSPEDLEECNNNIGDETSEIRARIAVQGCCHGALAEIYETIENYQNKTNHKIDFLLCCGDFQSLRNTSDYTSLAVPPKYREIGTFHEYYSGSKTAPVLTIFIGGNHESMKALQELYYGGWVAPNIYYLGCAGVINVRLGSSRGRLRIGGLSGIYKGYDYTKGHYEFPPYANDTLKSVYHVRSVDTFRLQCLSTALKNENGSDGNIEHSPLACLIERLHIMLTHDWPRGIEQHGDTQGLLRKKKFFTQEVRENRLGSPISEQLLYMLRPERWYSAHLHVKFEATIKHSKSNIDDEQDNQLFVIDKNPMKNNDEKMDNDTAPETKFIALESDSCMQSLQNIDLPAQMTRFLALDKCARQRKHLQVLTIPYSPTKVLSTTINEAKDEKKKEMLPSETKVMENEVYLEYDLQWLAILRKTHKMSSSSNRRVNLPLSPINITSQDLEDVRSLLELYYKEHRKEITNNESSSTPDGPQHQIYYFRIPNNFTKTVPSYGEEKNLTKQEQDKWWSNGTMIGNPQTDEFLDMMKLHHILTVPYKFKEGIVNEDIKEISYISMTGETSILDQDEIDLDEEEDENEGSKENKNLSNESNDHNTEQITKIVASENENKLRCQESNKDPQEAQHDTGDQDDNEIYLDDL